MEENIKCPTCGGRRSTQLGNNQCQCEYCGEIFTYMPKTESNQEPPLFSANRDTKKCPYCGSIIPAESQKCKNCGEWLNYHFQDGNNTNTTNQYEQYTSSKSRAVAILLAFFLGLFGIHKFYLGQNKLGLCYLLATLFLGWAGVGVILVGIACIIDCIVYITMSHEDFVRKYH